MSSPSIYIVGTPELCQARYGPTGPSIAQGTLEELTEQFPEALLPIVPVTDGPIAVKNSKGRRKKVPAASPNPDKAA